MIGAVGAIGTVLQMRRHLTSQARGTRAESNGQWYSTVLSEKGYLGLEFRLGRSKASFIKSRIGIFRMPYDGGSCESNPTVGGSCVR